MVYKAHRYTKLVLKFLNSFFECYIAIYYFQIHYSLKKRLIVKDLNNPTIQKYTLKKVKDNIK